MWRKSIMIMYWEQLRLCCPMSTGCRHTGYKMGDKSCLCKLHAGFHPSNTNDNAHMYIYGTVLKQSDLMDTYGYLWIYLQNFPGKAHACNRKHCDGLFQCQCVTCGNYEVFPCTVLYSCRPYVPEILKDFNVCDTCKFSHNHKFIVHVICNVLNWCMLISGCDYVELICKIYLCELIRFYKHLVIIYVTCCMVSMEK